MNVSDASDVKAKLLISSVVAGAAFLLAAITWSLLTSGTLRLCAPVAGFFAGVACSFVYRRRVGVKLGSRRRAGGMGS